MSDVPTLTPLDIKKILERLNKIEINYHRIVVKEAGCPNWLLNLESKVKEIEKIMKDSQVGFHKIFHDTINTRIKNLCNVLGMKLNDTESPTITEMKKFSATLYDIVEGLRQGQIKLKEQQKIEHNNFKARAREKWRRMDRLEGILQTLGKKVYDYIGAENFGSWNDFINKFSKTQLENVRDVEKKRLGENERVITSTPFIIKKPVDVKEIDSPNKNSCNHVYTSQYPYWECGICGFVKFGEFKDKCEHDFILESNIASFIRVKCLKCNQFFNLSESSIQLIKNFIDEKAKQT